MEATKYQQSLMQHTCGLSNSENRNWFGTGKGKDADEFDKLVEAGLATRRPAPSWTGDEFIYSLTDEGRKIAAETMPKPEILSRSKMRYRRYLEYGDGFNSFIDFCRWDSDKERSWNS